MLQISITFMKRETLDIDDAKASFSCIWRLLNVSLTCSDKTLVWQRQESSEEVCSLFTALAAGMSCSLCAQSRCEQSFSGNSALNSWYDAVSQQSGSSTSMLVVGNPPDLLVFNWVDLLPSPGKQD